MAATSTGDKIPPAVAARRSGPVRPHDAPARRLAGSTAFAAVAIGVNLAATSVGKAYRSDLTGGFTTGKGHSVDAMVAQCAATVA
ncbi:hypothetical protein [Amycolatopsis antarctica]|uniref:hypothetical protein n=1 Tax=Amycolatopsis antarctica TaxID=1854586 RepID=UPI001056A589|nr:hypothetical protein [Amycolatopsis antarctica]